MDKEISFDIGVFRTKDKKEWYGVRFSRDGVSIDWVLIPFFDKETAQKICDALNMEFENENISYRL